MTLTIVYDNNSYDETLQTAWGFACLVQAGGSTVLFDTGGDSPRLMGNMEKLGLDPREIDAVMISHIHRDHTGGLVGLLAAGARPTVYVPDAFPGSYKGNVGTLAPVVGVTGPMEFLPGFYTTGEVGSGMIEQALAVRMDDGLVVVTGCAHPGIVEMVRRAEEAAEADEVALLVGGFHLGGVERQRLEEIIADLRELGVRRVAPCHCTGDRAREMFAEAFGEDFVPAGVGRLIRVGAGGGEVQ